MCTISRSLLKRGVITGCESSPWDVSWSPWDVSWSQLALYRGPGSSGVLCAFALHIPVFLAWNTAWCWRWSRCLATAQRQGEGWVVGWKGRRSLAPWGPDLSFPGPVRWEGNKCLPAWATDSGFSCYSQGSSGVSKPEGQLQDSLTL